MNEYLIICRSITHAQRTARVLQRAGISHQVFRVPAGLGVSGCGYVVRLREKDLRWALQLLRREDVPLRGLFVRTENGYREVSYDLS